jgi:hypothetical protein
MSRQPSAIRDRCPECGTAAPGGRAGCQALFDELATPVPGERGLGAQRDLAFDAYCMQHPDTYCRSAKSYAAHLTRLCCGVEHGGDPRVYRAIQRRLNGTVALAKPKVLAERGRLTIADLRGAGSPEELQRLAQAWAEDVWKAYTSQHELAREWVKSALSVSETHGGCHNDR